MKNLTLVLLVLISPGLATFCAGQDLQALMDSIVQEKLRQRDLGKTQRLGSVLPDVTLQGLDGEFFSIEELIGKPMVINFWFTFCQPCISEIPLFNDLKKRYEKTDMNFVAITFQNAIEVREFLSKTDFDFQQVINARSFIDTLGIMSYPETMVVDRNLRVSSIAGSLLKNAVKEDEIKWVNDLMIEIDRVLSN